MTTITCLWQECRRVQPRCKMKLTEQKIIGYFKC